MVDPVTIVGVSVALWSAIAATITAFKDGSSVFSRWREKRGGKIKAKLSDELHRALMNGPDDVQSEYRRLLGLAGQRFARGDDHAVRAVLDSISKFNRTAIQVMRTAISQSSPLSLRSMLDATNTMRSDVISSLSQLLQRLRVANQIPRNPSRRSDESRFSDWGISCPQPHRLGPSVDKSLIRALIAPNTTLDLVPFVEQGQQWSSSGLHKRLEVLRASRTMYAMKEPDLGNLESARLVEAQCASLWDPGFTSSSYSV